MARLPLAAIAASVPDGREPQIEHRLKPVPQSQTEEAFELSEIGPSYSRCRMVWSSLWQLLGSSLSRVRERSMWRSRRSSFCDGCATRVRVQAKLHPPPLTMPFP